MIRFAWRVLRSLLLLLILAGGLYLASPYLLAAAGRYLVTRDPLAAGDMVLVLSGQPFLRVPEAARIYHEGLAPQILLTNAPRPAGQEELFRVGIRFPDAQEISLQLLDALRVPRTAVLTIPERADSGRGEAALVSRLLASRRVRTLIVVTSKAQSTRARMLLREQLGEKLRLLMHPAPADPFDPEAWWKNRASFRQVLLEYQALADLWRARAWQGIVGEATAPPPPVTVR